MAEDYVEPDPHSTDMADMLAANFDQEVHENAVAAIRWLRRTMRQDGPDSMHAAETLLTLGVKRLDHVQTRAEFWRKMIQSELGAVDWAPLLAPVVYDVIGAAMGTPLPEPSE